MGAEWCVENSLRWCSAHSLHAHILFRPFFPWFDFPDFLSSIRRLVHILPFPAFSLADDDTAQYLSEALRTSNQDQRRRSTTEVKNALEETRAREEMMELGFEDRVSAALSVLGVS